ncbi:auxilin-related protein 1 [Mercurialis annua]|uniref:auxilin-related protein 1 n=1 Tax=Mercurialis annua TaxID=3986 RepID=UPI00215E798A|nr:auxilin-related protein 1 [Mercurialis annua]
MDTFDELTKGYGIKPQGKSAPMALSKQPITPNFTSSSYDSSDSRNSSYNSISGNGSFSFNNYNEPLFSTTKKPQDFNGLNDYNDDGFMSFGGFQKSSNSNRDGSFDPLFSNSGSFSGDDLLSGFDGFNSNNNNASNSTDYISGSFISQPKDQSAPVNDLFGDSTATFQPPSKNRSVSFDDLIPGFGDHSSHSSNQRENTGKNNSTYTSTDAPFIVLESNSTTAKSNFTEPVGKSSKCNHSGSRKPAISPNVLSPLKPPPKPGQILKSDKVKSSNTSSIDELEEFGRIKVRNNSDGHLDVRHAKEARERQATKANRNKEAGDATQNNQQLSADDIDFISNMGYRSSSAPRSRAATLDPIFDATINSRGEPPVAHKKSISASSSMRKASPTTSIVDDLPSMLGDISLFGGFEEVKGETEERRRARFDRHQRTQDRLEKAVADMKQRDLQTQYEQEERRRLADKMDFAVKSWAGGKEGNMRALLLSLQDVLWPECGWVPVPLADLLTSESVKKVYRKATLSVHPDKVQQKGATLEQKYIAEKVFDILKESWKKFEANELSK